MATITGVGNTPINIATDNKIDKLDDVQALATALGVGGDFLLGLLNGVTLREGEQLTVDELIAKAVDQVPDSDAAVDGVIEKIDSMKSKLAALESEVEQLKAEKEAAAAPEDKAAKQALIDNKLKLKSALTTEMSDAKNSLERSLNNSNITDEKKADIRQLLNKQDLSGKASTAPSSQTTTQSYEPAVNSGTSTVNTGKAQTSGTDYDKIMGKANSGIDLGIGGDDSVLQLYDIQSEQQKRQHMMTLFFYYARMAMSGDVGAMYQFMRFIGYVIAKDKALQNVWMGTKLIELQETSRKATEKLLNTEVGESAVEQAEWQKELQKIKSEESIVATSQKLISQMMEEFTQVVETLTNVQKSLLDVNGKILSNLSVWR